MPKTTLRALTLAPLSAFLVPSALALAGCDSASSKDTIEADTSADTSPDPDTTTPEETIEEVVDRTPIAIASTTPGDGGCAPVGEFGITIRTTESVNPASLAGAFEVRVTTTLGSGPFDVPVRFGGGSTQITLTPEGDQPYWGASGTWTVEVAAGITDLAGNAMASPYTWTFTSPCGQ